jgi:glucosyl-3-phosphoglycerate synthase
MFESDKWMIKTFHSSAFLAKTQLLQAKKQRGIRISVVIPALNEERTIGTIVSRIHQKMVEEVAIVDEIVVMDGFSNDSTVKEAIKAGASVYTPDSAGPKVNCSGKGVALWKSQFVTTGDILVFIDSDIIDFDERFICGLLGPLLIYQEYEFVKAFYKRPLLLGSGVYENQGGRVTEILVRPLLSAFIPELAFFNQPLAGEYAISRSLLETLPVFSGYGVEIGLLMDIYFSRGLSRVAQVDMEQRWHRNRTVAELSMMSFALLNVMVDRMKKHGLLSWKSISDFLIVAEGLSYSRETCEESELSPKINFSKECTHGSF